MKARLGCIVEEAGRLRQCPCSSVASPMAIDPGLYVVTTDLVIKVPRYKLVRPGEIERPVRLLAARRADAALVLIDSDDDCPAELGPDLLLRGSSAYPRASYWGSDREDGIRELVPCDSEIARWQAWTSHNLAPHQDPENIRGAKGWLDRNMSGTRGYKETSDKAAFSAMFDMDAARTSCDSFRKCHEEVASLLSPFAVDPV